MIEGFEGTGFAISVLFVVVVITSLASRPII